jgi:phosphatidylserine/phosphatidylglycerophosphate/cardiolipin synthase-like enzyme
MLITTQAWENRLRVPEDQYSVGKVRLPAAEEIPNVDLQVINYHRPIFGTFHAKFTVIDRRIALLQSSNIQDNDNLEILAHIEGPIVDSFYDAALLSWGKPLDPPLPLLSSPAINAPIPCHEARSPDLSLANGTVILPEHSTSSSYYDVTMAQEVQRVNSGVYSREGESPTQAVTRYLSMWF